MDRYPEDLMSNAQLENDVNLAIEEDLATVTGGADEDAEMQNTEEDYFPGELLGKRAGESSPSDVQPDLKKQKLQEQSTLDVAEATPPQAEGNSYNKKQQKAFKAPKTPPGTSRSSTAPATPPGKQPYTPNPSNAPAKRKGLSRFSHQYRLLYDPVDSFYASKVCSAGDELESGSDSGSVTGSDTDEEFFKKCAEEAEGKK